MAVSCAMPLPIVDTRWHCRVQCATMTRLKTVAHNVTRSGQTLVFCARNVADSGNIEIVSCNFGDSERKMKLFCAMLQIKVGSDTTPVTLCATTDSVTRYQPHLQANSRYPSDRKRLGSEREFSKQALRVTSRQNSPGTTGDEADGILLRFLFISSSLICQCTGTLIWNEILVTLKTSILFWFLKDDFETVAQTKREVAEKNNSVVAVGVSLSLVAGVALICVVLLRKSGAAG